MVETAGSTPQLLKTRRGWESELGSRLLLRVREASELCGMPASTGYALVASGEWPTVRNGRAIRIPTAGLLRWIEENTEA